MYPTDDDNQKQEGCVERNADIAKGDNGKADCENPEDCQDDIEGHLFPWEREIWTPFFRQEQEW